MKWKKLNTKKILDHKRLTVFEDKVLLPSGKKTDYVHFGKRPGSATIIAINDRGKILLQKEYSYPLGKSILQFPGGAIENNETPLEGAAREFAEEGRLKGELTKIGWLYSNNRKVNSKMHVFVATDLGPASGQRDPEEEFEDFWYSPGEINELIRRNELNNHMALAAWAIYTNSDYYRVV